MKRIFIFAGILAMLLGIISCGNETPTSSNTPALQQGSAQSYEDYRHGLIPPLSKGNFSDQQMTVQGNLTVYTDLASFLAESGSPTLANFNNSNLPPNSIGFCRAINSNTNNHVYSPGAIPDGISVEALGSEINAVLTRGFLGLPNTVVGPNFFAADMNIKFDPAIDLVGMELYNPFGPAVLDIEFFAPGDVFIGTVSGVLTGTTVPSFLGVRITGITASRLRFRQTAGSGGELVDNVLYGLGN
jgi:hypothetical protein